MTLKKAYRSKIKMILTYFLGNTCILYFIVICENCVKYRNINNILCCQLINTMRSVST